LKNKSFSALLEEFRVARNMSKTDLAKRANLTPGYISHLTRGERAAPSESVVQILADVLKLDIEARAELFEVAGYSYDIVSLSADIVPSSEEIQASSSGEATKVNWDDIPDVSTFYGRDDNQELLAQWITDEGCRIVAILGIGGIGKTSLAAKVVTTVAHQFDCVFWQSLRDAPPIKTVLTDCIQFLSDRTVSLPKEEEDWLPILLETLSQCLRERRCLIVLDNFESVLQSGERAGKYQTDHEEFGRLIQSIDEGKHQSSLILTSREKPKEIVLLEGKTALVRSTLLTGLIQPDVEKLISDKGLSGSNKAWADLIELYSGNPLALKLAAEPILQVFGGDIDAFLHEGETVFGDIYELIKHQFYRLSSLEQIVMYWLAIEREPVSLEKLQENILPKVSKKDLLEVLTSLRRRSMIEPSGTARFLLQPVIMEFTIDQLIEHIYNEITELKPQLLRSCALINAHAKDDVRNSQMRLILAPIARWLEADLGKEESLQRLKDLLSSIREMRLQVGEYAVGNILNLLNQYDADLSHYDFSDQVIRHAFLQGVTLAGVNFANATFVDSVFTDTFGKILSVAISPNGKLLAAGVANNEVRLWKFPNITPLLTLQGHSDWVRAVAFSPDSKLLASASEDKTVQIWEIATGKPLFSLKDHTSLVYSVAFSPDGKLLASCGDDQTIRLWEVSSGRCLNVLRRGHENKVWSVAFSGDGQLLISGSDDHTLCLWEVNSGRLLHQLTGHTGKIWTVAFSSDGELVASGSYDQTIRIWEVSSGECISVLKGHSSWVYSVTFSPDGRLLASGSDDQQVGIWNVRTGERRLLHRHSNRVRSVAFSPDSTLLASGSDDQTIRLWEVKTGQCLSILQGYSNEVWAVTFSPDGKQLASGSEDQLARIWDIDNGQCTQILSGHTNRIQAIAFNLDGTLLATGSDDQTARLWQVNTGESLAVLQEPKTWIWAVAFSPKDSLLATAGEDQVVRIWDIDSVARINVFNGHTNWIWSAAFNHDGTLLATGSDDQTARIWDVNSGQSLHILNGHSSRVRAVAFNHDGTLLATGSDDQTTRIWQVDTGQCIRELTGHDGWVRSVAFNRYDTLLATGSDDQTIRLWQVSTGQSEVLTGHTNSIRSVDFSPDGTLLASGGQDGKIIVWKVQTGESRQEFISRRPYEDANITGVKGLSMAQRVTLRALGAVER